MNSPENIYASPASVASQPMDTRATFIRKTYYHLAGAIAVFALLVTALNQAVLAAGLEDTVIGFMRGWTWLIVLGLYMLVSNLADKWARTATTKAMQYSALSVYTLIEAVLFTPIILFATTYLPAGEMLVLKAAAITGFLFLGLSFIAITTKKDFSFLGGILKIGGFIALGLIVVSVFFGGVSLGMWFSVAMVAFAGASILYNTSNMIHHYRTDQYISASLGLFASVTLLFWYVLRILMSLASSD